MLSGVTDKIGGKVHTLKSMFEQFSLFWSRLQFDLSDQFHRRIIPHMFRAWKIPWRSSAILPFLPCLKAGYHGGFDDRTEICRAGDVRPLARPRPRPDGRRSGPTRGRDPEQETLTGTVMYEPVSAAALRRQQQRGVKAAEEATMHSQYGPFSMNKTALAVKRRMGPAWRRQPSGIRWAVQHGRGRQPVSDG